MSSEERSIEGHVRIDDQAIANYAGLLGRPINGVRWTTDYEPNLLLAGRQTVRGAIRHLGSRERAEFAVVTSDDDQLHDAFARSGLIPAKRREIWLIPAATEEDGGYTERRYPVLTDRRCRDLHRQFARLGTARSTRVEEEIRRFATRFGFLGSPSELVRLQPRGGSAFSQRDCPVGEHIVTWRAESLEAAALVALWDLIRDENRDEVAKHVLVRQRPRRVEVNLAWKDRRLTTDRSLRADWRIATSDDPLEEVEVVADESTARGRYRLALVPSLARSKPDVLDAARLWLFDRINLKLWGRVSPQLRAERQVGERFLFVPHSLLGAVYVYFVREVEGRTMPGTPCANPMCDQTIDASWNRKYCDERCRDQARYLRDREKRRKPRGVRTPTRTPTSADNGECR